MLNTNTQNLNSTRRNQYTEVAPGQINNKKRNRRMEDGKMSKLFTRDRRKDAKTDFDQRRDFNLHKKEAHKKELEDRFYNFDFQPKINKKRININPKNLPPNVYRKKTHINRIYAKKMEKKKMREKQINRSNYTSRSRTNSNLGRDTHMKKIQKHKDQTLSNISNLGLESNGGEDKAGLEERVGKHFDSIKFDYSVTNNASLESIHNKLKKQDSELEVKKFGKVSHFQNCDIEIDPNVQSEELVNFPNNDYEGEEVGRNIKFAKFSKSNVKISQNEGEDLFKISLNPKRNKMKLKIPGHFKK